MKKNTLVRMIALILCAACLLLPLSAGTAEAGGNGEADLLNRLRTVPDFKFQNHSKGIGTGTCAVYTAPSTGAYRTMNGRATCDLAGEVGEAGYVNGWLLVRYKTDGGRVRVGYIKKDEAGDYKSSMTGIKGDPIPLTAAADIPLIEAPSDYAEQFGTIGAGETFYVLRKYTYTGSWWYVECEVDGRTARGFIERDAAPFCFGAGVDPASGATVYDMATLGYPEISPRNTGVIGHFEVSEGPRKRVRKEAGDTDRITVAYAGRYYPCYDVVTEEDGKAWYYIWVEEDSLWGWISSTNGEFVQD